MTWSLDIEKQSEQITTDFFDDILRCVEDILAKELFDEYFQSSFFQNYKKKMRLKEGLQYATWETFLNTLNVTKIFNTLL